MQCEYCERHFSKTAAERHIEFCKEQKNRLIQPQVDNNALTRLMARYVLGTAKEEYHDHKYHDV